MFPLVIVFVQIFFVQYAVSQTVATPTVINNGMGSVYGPNIPGINPAALSAANIGAGLPGQMMAAGISGQAFGPMGAPALGIPAAQLGMPGAQLGMPGAQLGMPGAPLGMSGAPLGMSGAPIGMAAAQMALPSAIGANPLAVGYANPYGGNGNGDVAVAGELPVAGTTVVTGQVPLTGKVQFTGSLPAGGIVTISGQCGCGCNGQYNPTYAPKTGYNNKPYIY